MELKVQAIDYTGLAALFMHWADEKLLKKTVAFYVTTIFSDLWHGKSLGIYAYICETAKTSNYIYHHHLEGNGEPPSVS
jgi:hypothetical protein